MQRIAGHTIFSSPPDGDAGGEWSSYAVDRTVMRHVCASLKESHGQQFWGMAFDKANSRGLDLQNGFNAFPSNVAFELVSQVGLGL